MSRDLENHIFMKRLHNLNRFHTSLAKEKFQTGMLDMITSPANPNMKQENSPSGLVSFPSRFDDGERSMTCPTCGGTGRLTQEHEHDLVALIPVRDNRLKPRRMLYTFIVLLLIAIITGIITTVFLFPRDVTIDVISTRAINVSVSKDNVTTPFIIINNTMQINNSNFFEVTLTDISQQVTWDQNYVVAEDTFSGMSITVPSKSDIMHNLIVKTEYQKEAGKKVRNACFWLDILLVIDSQAQATGVTVSQQLTNKVYKWVSCLDQVKII